MADFLGTNADDTFVGDATDELIHGGGGDDDLSGGDGNDTIYGDGGDDIINGNGGDDLIYLTRGVDTVDGGIGTNTLYVDYSAVNDGTMTVDLRGAFTGGTGKITIGGVNGIISNMQVLGQLDGSVAKDIVYMDDITAGFTINLLAGHDKFIGGSGDDVVDGGAGNDDLKGGDGDDTLIGGNGDDILNGNAGADDMTGGAGNDLYYVNDAGDIVTETSATGGKDTVSTSVSFALGSFVEKLLMTGAGDIDGLGNDLNNRMTGNIGANILDGGAGNDVLKGGDGDDTLIGGDGIDFLNGNAGADDMAGGKGNDTYKVNDLGDTVTEVENGGVDKVYSSVSFTLGDFVERLVLTGQGDNDGIGNSLNNRIVGNAGDNYLEGGAGDDIIFGMGGADIILGGAGNDVINGYTGSDEMYGGAGNDIYIVNVSTDIVSEDDGLGGDAGGTDLVKSKASFQLGDYIEKLTLTGSADIDGTGNDKGNDIVGNSGNNVLSGEGGKDTILGGGGNDQIHGGLGADILVGGSGQDLFVFDVMETSGNRDTIRDFTVGTDTVVLDAATFTGFDGDAAGFIDASRFGTGTEATTLDQRLVYNTTSGILYYDADGSDVTIDQVAIAYFDNKAALSAEDIFLNIA